MKNAERPYLRAAALTSAGAFPDEVLLAVLGMNRSEEHTSELQSQAEEEHTSELQSHAYLVCRLLLEKKKISNPISFTAPQIYSLLFLLPTRTITTLHTMRRNPTTSPYIY